MKKVAVWISILTMALFYQGILNVGSANKVSAAEATGNFDYTCVATALGQPVEIDMKVKPTVTVPDSVEPNSTVTVENLVTDVELDLTGSLDGLRGLINPFKGHVDQFNIEVNGEVENAVGADGVPIPDTPHEDGDEFVPFKVEGNDTTFDVGEEDVEIVAGEIVAQIESSLATLPATCTPDGDSVIATVKVEEEEEEEEDLEAPVITLNGDNPMELEVGDTYDEPGATAEDDVDGDVTDNIEISGDVDTSKVGEYEVVYTVSDEAGNEATEIRIVNVVEPEEEPGNGEDGDGNGEDGNGEDGEDGNGEDGEDGNGEDGEDGNGEDGEDGNGEDGEDGQDGQDGEDGQDGIDGKDGDVVQEEKDNGSTVVPSTDNNNGSNGPGTLPNTATDNPLFIALGAGLLLVGGGVMIARRKRLI